MPAQNQEVSCRHCGAAMEHLNTGYALPEVRSSNLDEVKIDPKRTINLQVLRCSNPDCDFIELKAPKRWPTGIPRPQ